MGAFGATAGLAGFSTAGGFSSTLGALGASSGLTGFSVAAGFSFVSGAAFPPGAGADWAALPAAFAGTAGFGHFSDAAGVARGLQAHSGRLAGVLFAIGLIDASIKVVRDPASGELSVNVKGRQLDARRWFDRNGEAAAAAAAQPGGPPPGHAPEPQPMKIEAAIDGVPADG